MSFNFEIKGRSLPKMDRKSSDPYFVMSINGDKIYKSKTIKNNLNPDWEGFSVHRDKFGQFPRMIDIKIDVYDKDTLSKDDYMCTGYFKLVHALDQPALKLDMVNEKKGEAGGH